jgi:glycosyltransferase involved in cell wall biosynthesis
MFSVIMPAFNVEAYIAAAIQGVIDQTYKAWELVIVDDGSSDRTLQIAREFADRDSRIRVIAKAHGGLSDTYQTALEAAQYEWVAVLDSDDLAYPNRLQRQYQAIQAQPEIIGWGSYGDYINTEGRHILVSKMGPTTVGEFYAWRNRAEPWVCVHSTWTFRRDIALRVGGYSAPLICPDYYLMAMMVDHGVMLTIPEVLGARRFHTKSTTLTKHQKLAQHMRYVWTARAEVEHGRSIPTFEAFLEMEKHRPALNKLQTDLLDRSRFHWMLAGLKLSEHGYVQTAQNLAMALFYSPMFAGPKLWAQIQEQLLHRSSQTPS